MQKMKENSIVTNYKLLEFDKEKLLWKCECTNCSSIKFIKEDSLLKKLKTTPDNKFCRSCNKNIPVKKDFEVGMQIGSLKILNYIPRNEKAKNWQVKCNCGSEPFFMKTNELVKRKFHECIECARIRRGISSRKEDAALTCIFASYKLGSKNRKLSFNLEKSYFEKLITENCFYCNNPPSNIFYRSYCEYKYNGIDRIDNKEGYEPNNCVSCCIICNQAKMNHSVEDFGNWLRRISTKFEDFIKSSETISLGEYISSEMEKEGVLKKDNDIVRTV